MKKILILADAPGWIVDRITDLMIENIKGFEFTKKYYSEITPTELIELSDKFDLIHYQNYELDRFGFIPVLNKLKAPLILSVRSHRYMAFTNWINHLKVLWKIKYFHVIDKELLKKFPGATYISDGTDMQIFKPNNDFVVGFAGKPGGYYKGFGDDYKGYKLVEQACKELGVAFKPATGNLKPNKMPDYYKSINLLVQASINEGYGAAVVEAMAMNIPVISTNVGAAKNLNIVKIERTIESIKDGILKFYTRPQVEKIYDWNKIYKEFEEYYADVINQQN